MDLNKHQGHGILGLIRRSRPLLSIAAALDYEIWQIDVKTAFHNGYLEESIYMEQLEGFKTHDQ